MFEKKWVRLAFFSPLGGLLIYGFLQFILSNVFSMNQGMMGGMDRNMMSSEMGGSSGSFLFNFITFIFTLLIVLFIFALFIGLFTFLLIYLKRTFFPNMATKQVLKQLISGDSTSNPPATTEALEVNQKPIIRNSAWDNGEEVAAASETGPTSSIKN
ncbi:hypothetical protein P5G65_23630 [Paenibacillus chondroitinus]|uniref:Uncharacterized protein n=1 Tax=Paenibacillus chondroitinus TaxID=59842 RepID=A0ABU6DHV7_9BACL|nr:MULTISPECIES: hypothetical protein [Paenibacillus]MCY9659502.1 hypothetical protein [Paenibacillus anseongense]MEB4796897.1 hypothetical protein [Paenibacillus chondroitinus]